jgi:hypothetical protein
VCRAQWPANLGDLEAVLLARPVMATRNWLPGETVADLVGENVDNGLVPESSLDRQPLMVVGDTVTAGKLSLGFATHARALEG